MTQKTKEQDKRRFPRVPKNVNMTVKKLQYPLTNVRERPAITKNVADKGVCFVTTELYERGILLSLNIDLRGWQQYLENVFSVIDADTITRPLTAIAEVVWVKKLTNDKGYTVGVRFQDIYEDDLKALQKYLNAIIEKDNML